MKLLTNFIKDIISLMLLQFDTFRFSLKDFNRYLKSVTYDEYEWKLIYMEQNVYWCSRILQTLIQCERSKLNKPVEFFAPNIYSGNLSHTHTHAHTHSHILTHARTHALTHAKIGPACDEAPRQQQHVLQADMMWYSHSPIRYTIAVLYWNKTDSYYTKNKSLKHLSKTEMFLISKYLLSLSKWKVS